MLRRASLEHGIDRNNGTPGIIESKSAKVTNLNSFGMARAFTVPVNGKSIVRLANFSDHPIIVQSGQTLGHSYPLHRIFASVNTFDSSTSYSRRGDLQKEPEKPKDRQDCKTEVKANSTGLSNEDKKSFTRLLDKYAELFDNKQNRFGHTHLVEHAIDIGSAHHIKQAPLRSPPFKRDEVEKQLGELMGEDRIELSNSPWSSPVVLAQKRDDMESSMPSPLKMHNHYPGQMTFSSILIVPDGFLALILSPATGRFLLQREERGKAAFVTHKGQFQWKSMPFGLTNGPASF